MKRAVIAGGGTGGHFYPAYVTGTALKKNGWEVLFLIRRGDPAAVKLAAEDIAFVEMDLKGIPRRDGSLPWFSFEWIKFLSRFFGALRLAYRAIRAFQPQCVVGMGGHVSFPAVFAAWRLRIPSLLHESNAQLGLANQACIPFAMELAMGLPLAKRPAWPGKIRARLCGTPVRPEFWDLPDAAESRRSLGLDPGKRTILVFGGSQGALGINQRVPPAILKLMHSHREVQCLHLSGPMHEEEAKTAYAGKAMVMPYLQEMHKAYAAADLVICRSGASTLAELIATRKPAVLVPLPTAAEGHQAANAQALVEVGAARRVDEKNITPEALASLLEDLIFSSIGGHSRLQEMSENYNSLPLPKPQETVSLLLEQVEALARKP